MRAGGCGEPARCTPSHKSLTSLVFPFPAGQLLYHPQTAVYFRIWHRKLPEGHCKQQHMGDFHRCEWDRSQPGVTGEQLPQWLPCPQLGERGVATHASTPGCGHAAPRPGVELSPEVPHHQVYSNCRESQGLAL